MSKQQSAEKIKHLFNDSITKLQQGNAVDAMKGFSKLTTIIPKQSSVWYNLAISYQHLNQHAKALEAYKQVLNLAPNNADAAVGASASQNELGQTKAAMQSAKMALKISPEHARALNMLGTLYAEQHDHVAADKVFCSLLNHAPQPGEEVAHEDARHNLANSKLQNGNAESALAIIEPLLGQANTQKRHRVLYVQALIDLKRFDEAFKIVSELNAQFSDDAEIMLLDMSLQEMIRDYFSVINLATELLKKNSDQVVDIARVWNSLGGAYFQLDSVSKAAECYDQAVANNPGHPEYSGNRGLAHAAMGEKVDAERCYRKALALNPAYAEAYRNLVSMKHFSSTDDDDVRAIEQLWRDSKIDDFTRTKLAFTLGKVYDDTGEYARAFETYAVGNRLKFAEATMDFDKYFSHIDAICEVFTTPPTQVAQLEITATPIFILGMPRSGTTLVEQILSRHPAVSACGELPCIEKAISRLERHAEPMRTYPWDFVHIDSASLEQERQNYLSWVGRLHEIKTAFFTDKMPFNFVHLWLIKSLFPHAALVHCHRHPLDVIISNYFQLYASDINFVYELEVLTHYYIRYYRLMSHWQKVFGEAVYRVQYETLVGNKDEQTRKLVAAAKLPWDDACLNTEKTSTPVRTASIWQVRQKIYTTSRGRWRHYEKELAPAIRILQSEGILDTEMVECSMSSTGIGRGLSAQ